MRAKTLVHTLKNAVICFGACSGVLGCSGPAHDLVKPTRLQLLAESVGCSNVATPSPGVLAMIQANNAFGFGVFQKGISNYEGGVNRLMSTLSLTQALQMLLAGTANATQTQLAVALGFPSQSSSEVSTTSRFLLAALGCRQGYTLQVANSIWSDGNLEVLPNYARTLSSDYAAYADFSSALTVGDINDWVSQNTDGMIPQFLSSLSSDLTLVNAIAFNGLWAQPFSPAQPSAFTLDTGDVIEASTLEGIQVIRTGQWEGFSVAAIPYGVSDSSAAGDAELVLLVPPEGQTPESVLGKLAPADYQGLDSAIASWLPAEAYISFPKFSFSKILDLMSYIASPASGLSFLASETADFSLMADGKPVLNAAGQKTLIDVNETGTQAAAATSDGVVGAAGPATSFTADHPFIFILRDAGGSDLFIGAVHDPSSHDSE